MSKQQDHYAVLGVSHTASKREIREAYRRLARQHHPDVNPGDSQAGERFQQLRAAVETLGDPVRRQHYDAIARMGTAGLALLTPEQGYDVTYAVHVTWDELATGTLRQLSFHSSHGGMIHIAVPIPAGTRPGERLRVPNAGGPSRDGSARGDLIAVVQIGAPDTQTPAHPMGCDKCVAEGPGRLATWAVGLVVLLVVAGLIMLGRTQVVFCASQCCVFCLRDRSGS